jgi:type VI secretion system protein ImpH
MAADYRHELPALINEALKCASRFDFWQMLRLFENLGEINKLRLIPSASLAFPAADINSCAMDQKQRLIVELNFMGLYGRDSPLPYYFFDFTQRDSDLAECLRAFLDIFNHRLYWLLYLVWKKYHPFLFMKDYPEYQKYLNALAGLSFNHHEVNFIPISLLGAYAHNGSSLSIAISNYLEGAKVIVKQFIGSWVELVSVPKLGDKELILGCSAFLGTRAISSAQTVILEIGPLLQKLALEIFPGRPRRKELYDLIKSYIAPSLSFVINVFIKTEQQVCQRLGIDGWHLNWHSWLGAPMSNNYQIKFPRE